MNFNKNISHEDTKTRRKRIELILSVFVSSRQIALFEIINSNIGLDYG